MKEQILELRKKGYTYKQIVEEIGCSKSNVAYHCNPEVKRKTYERTKKYRKKYGRSKAERFSIRCSKVRKPVINKILNRQSIAKRKGHIPKPISWKRAEALRKEENQDVRWKSKDLLEKIGDNPTCYLTGKPIDLEDGKSYHIDHVIPTALGGSNKLENINICTKEANMAKADLMLEDFFQLCIDILEYNGYQVTHTKNIDNALLIIQEN